MGVFARGLKAGIGFPNPGWQPPMGWAGPSITDIIVNADTALTVGAFHAGVRLIAEDIASMPRHVFERRDKTRRMAIEHPSYAAIALDPNPEMTAMVWEETMIGHLLTWGNCYAEKELNGMGQTVRLWPLRPDRMTVERAPGTNRRIYKYRLPNGERIELPQHRVFHVPGFGFDGLIGYSRIRMARRSLENAIAIEEYGLRTFANGAQPGVAIRHKEQLSKEAKKNIAESWDDGHQGLTNVQRTAVLDEGMELETIGFPPEDAQFLDAKRHSVEEVARWLRLAPHKISDHSRATFSNIEESNIDHVVGTLMPIMVRFEQQIDKDILTRPFYVKHNAGHLMRGNAKDRAEFYRTMRTNGLMTDDEARALEDMDPLSEEDRQHVLWPLNSVPSSAYDDHGMTMKDRGALATSYVRTGYDPADILRVLGLPAIKHTGLVPITVTLDPESRAAQQIAESANGVPQP